jgi:hypothetical protein
LRDTDQPYGRVQSFVRRFLTDHNAENQWRVEWHADSQSINLDWHNAHVAVDNASGIKQQFDQFLQEKKQFAPENNVTFVYKSSKWIVQCIENEVVGQKPRIDFEEHELNTSKREFIVTSFFEFVCIENLVNSIKRTVADTAYALINDQINFDHDFAWITSNFPSYIKKQVYKLTRQKLDLEEQIKRLTRFSNDRKVISGLSWQEQSVFQQACIPLIFDYLKPKSMFSMKSCKYITEPIIHKQLRKRKFDVYEDEIEKEQNTDQQCAKRIKFEKVTS